MRLGGKQDRLEGGGDRWPVLPAPCTVLRPLSAEVRCCALVLLSAGRRAGGAGRRRGNKPNGDFCAASSAVVGGDAAAVAVNERVDDGQSESCAAGGARGVGAAESVEGTWEEAGWESGTVVLDTDLDVIGDGPGDVDGDRRGTVSGGVVDEVADDPIKVVGICASVLSCGAVDVELIAEAVPVAVADR